jgi:AMIN domain
MRALNKQIGSLALLLSCAAAAQTASPHAATIQNIEVLRDGSDLLIQVTLSSVVKPQVISASNPERLVLTLPNTLSADTQKRISVNYRGVRRVRVGLNKAEPPETHVVVDLVRTAPYTLQAEGNRITLILSSARKGREGAPAAAVAGPLISIFRRQPKSRQLAENQEPPPPVKPPPAEPPLVFTPPDEKQANATPKTEAKAGPKTEPETRPKAAESWSGSGAGTAPPATAAAQPQVAAAKPRSDPATFTSGAGAAATVSAGATAGSTASVTPGTDETAMPLSAADPGFRTVFKVKYVAEGVAYLDGGRSSGLAEGMKLEVKDGNLPPQQGATADPSDPNVMAELQVSGVADTSAVTDIHSPKRPVKLGDWAYLSASDVQALIQQRALSATRKYPAVVTFTEDDALAQEAYAEAPRPPMPSVNRARGRIGFDYMGTVSHGNPGLTSSDLGLVLRADITRIGGTYWNLSGYWRGRLNSQSSATQQTLQDLINRTYHLEMTYENPNSGWVAGFGRLYLPWAPSLNTIDGGYFGRRLSSTTTTGIFAGSTPDPASWNFDPTRRIAGAFVNFTGGSYDYFHYTSTSGLGLSTLKWQIDRPFVFFENTLSYKRYLSIHDSLQADSPRGNQAVAAPGPGLSRNFFTLRLQPHPRVELDFNHTYFRDIPRFDPALIGTGLLDKYLFQGFSVGGRVEVVTQIFLYTDIGRSNRTGDAKNSWNQMYGVTFGQLPWINLRADLHYSKFDSSFGAGSYRSFSLSRNITDVLRLEVLAGDQSYSSSFSSSNRARFVTGNVETSFGSHYFLQGGFTTSRGNTMNYDQWMLTLGYRFDSRSKRQ